MSTIYFSFSTEKPAIAPPVFVFQKEKTQKRSADGSSAEDGDDSDREDGEYCPPLKRERTSSLTQFPPSHSVSKNNVFMPTSFCQSPTGNSDSEPEEKPVGFRLKPPTLIHGQAPSAGVPSQKPKEQQRSVLRPAVLQAPPTKTLSEPSKSNSSCGTNGVGKFSDAQTEDQSIFQNSTESSDKSPKREAEPGESSGAPSEDDAPRKEAHVNSGFVFGQNIKERAKVEENSSGSDSKDSTQDSQSGSTNYFLQYIGTSSSLNATNNTDKGAKFVFGQNMSERVLSPPKGSESTVESNRDTVSASEPSSQETTPEKLPSVTESLEESAAAYTKATAKKCILEKVEVRTGEEAESNVLQMQCKLFVFDKPSQSWVERGRGLLRLNDMASTDDGTLRSRLVMRTQGSLRLILNTKLWAQMQVDKASEKSVRITAMDTEDQGVKVFLISASSKDAGQLAAALHHRILALRSRAEQETESTPTPPQADAPRPDQDDSDEDDLANNSAGMATAGSASGTFEASAPVTEST
ncbi:ran-binding protein 3b isoform X2 [Brachyhypopomus gauderio]|uniref:ran-binding protein 3b isoform X2 n=1 Tax=Brachyhypopomus gauderio TaxID=698409 RepID=UPI004041F7AB